jgi:hypothetical protein
MEVPAALRATVYSSAPETTPVMVKRLGFSCAAANEARRRTLAANGVNAPALAMRHLYAEQIREKMISRKSTRRV